MLSALPFELPARLMQRAEVLPPAAMAVAGADHPLALESAMQATRSGLIVPTLIGPKADIQRAAEALDWDLGDVRIVDVVPEAPSADAAVQLAAAGEVDAIMKGQIHSDTLMRAIVGRDAGLRTERRISHVFHMTAPGSDKALMITDGAVNVAPDEKTLIDIVANAADLARALGYETPKVAMLSGSESVIESMPSTVLARRIVERVQAGEIAGVHIDGPLALDNAVSGTAAQIKGITGPVAGAADILTVPNIEMGNALFKSLVYFRSAIAAGVVLGAKVPVVLTSRADPPEARLAATAIAKISAAHRA